MNIDWRDFVRFLLQGITLRHLIHTLIILIALVIFIPANAKEWINLHNPEILPPYWMYYVLLFCISFVLNSCLVHGKEAYDAGAKNRKKIKEERKIEEKIMQLSNEEKNILALYLDQQKDFVPFERNNHVVEALVEKGILINLGSIPYKANCDGYSIDQAHYHAVLRHTTEQQEGLARSRRRTR